MTKKIKIQIVKEDEERVGVDFGATEGQTDHQTGQTENSSSSSSHNSINSSSSGANLSNPKNIPQSSTKNDVGSNISRNNTAEAESDEVTEIDNSNVDKIRIQVDHKFKK